MNIKTAAAVSLFVLVLNLSCRNVSGDGKCGAWGIWCPQSSSPLEFPLSQQAHTKGIFFTGDGRGPWLSSQVQFCSSVQENLSEDKIKSANSEKVE